MVPSILHIKMQWIAVCDHFGCDAVFFAIGTAGFPLFECMVKTQVSVQCRGCVHKFTGNCKIIKATQLMYHQYVPSKIKECHYSFEHCILQEETVPYTFFVNETEVKGKLEETIEKHSIETEKVVEIVYQPQAVFKVRAVTRCTSTIPGETKKYYKFYFFL